MSTLSITHQTSPEFFTRVVRAVASFFEALGEGRQIARRYDALARLSDTALAARGLTRNDISRVAVHGR